MKLLIAASAVWAAVAYAPLVRQYNIATGSRVTGTVLAPQRPGQRPSVAQVQTIEGIAPAPGELAPIQDAFCETHGMQCGYCTPAMILTAHALIARNPSPTRDDIVEAISGNICRCTGYAQIVEAIALAAERIRGQNQPAAP